MSSDRPVKVVGVWKQQWHPNNCTCEACGPAYVLFLSEYEAKRLLEALETKNGADTGDWHGQLRHKLEALLGSYPHARST
jgi:hypothetical protein